MALASDAIASARRVLQDADAERASDAVLLGYLNGARRAILKGKPQTYATEADLTLVAGSKQTLPANCHVLLDMPRTTGGLPITVTEREYLDALLPGWRTMTAGPTQHFCYDEREPGSVDVYPPAVAGQANRIVFVQIPSDMAIGHSFTAREELLYDSIVDYMVGRTLLEDAESPANERRGMFHLTLFADAIGVSVKSILTNSPNTANVGGRLPKVATGR
jgi:hypothetical protein